MKSTFRSSFVQNLMAPLITRQRVLLSFLHKIFVDFCIQCRGTPTPLVSNFSTNSNLATPQDFLTLAKPGVLILVVYTAAAGLFLSPSPLHPFLSLIAIFAISLGSAGAAAFNMWYDRDIDLIMKRTQKRPLPQGHIAPNDALAFAWLLSITSVMLLYMATNFLAASLLAFSIFFYAVIYTVFLKRSTSQNIVIGGAAGAFPPVIGWAAATNSLAGFEPWILFAIIFIWTPSHFWALAVYRSEDYKKAKIPMMPLTAGIKKTKKQIVFYSILLVITSLSILFVKPISPFYITSALLLGAFYIALSLKLYASSKPSYGMKLFGYSIFYLFFLFSSLLIDTLFIS